MTEPHSTEIAADTNEPRPAPAGAEQRTRPGYPCGTITLTRLSLASSSRRSYFAWVHDVSEGGIGLDVLVHLAVGAEIVFELRGAGANVRLHAKIVHSTPVGSYYRLGCKFTRPVRRDALTALLPHGLGS
jgi:hypothetical protein